MKLPDPSISKMVSEFLALIRNNEGFIPEQRINTNVLASIAIDRMLEFGLIKRIPEKPNLFILTKDGYLFDSTEEVLEEIKTQKEKAANDAVISRQTKRSINRTRIMAIIGCVVSICLLLLKLAEALSIL